MRALVLVVALAACGGKSSPAAPAPAEEAEPAPAQKPPPSHEQHVGELEDLATRGCACADTACIGAVDADLAALIRELPVPAERMSESLMMSGVEALGRYLVCTKDLGAFPELASYAALGDRLDEVAAVMCACRDTGCSERAANALVPELILAHELAKKNRALATKVTPHFERLEACSLADAMSQQAIADLTALRDTACACATPECADAVDAEFEAFLEKHEDTKGDQESAETIGRIAGEMSSCLAKAKGEAP